MTPLADIQAEALRVIAAAADDQFPLRVLGGVGIALRCPSASCTPLRRAYADLDLAGAGADRKAIVRVLTDLGYTPDVQFNAVHGATRLFFWDAANNRQLDVFLDRFEMCHRLTFASRLELAGPALPAADLLLMKLQIFETNEKDLRDITALLVDQPFAHDDSGINLPYIQQLTGADWGLWRTSLMVAERARVFAHGLDSFERAAEVNEKVQAYAAALDATPKTKAWKLRARVGERKRWYELPEESH